MLFYNNIYYKAFLTEAAAVQFNTWRQMEKHIPGKPQYSDECDSSQETSTE